jgi:hypothetical protein
MTIMRSTFGKGILLHKRRLIGLVNRLNDQLFDWFRQMLLLTVVRKPQGRKLENGGSLGKSE